MGLFTGAVEQLSVLWWCLQGLLNSGQCCRVVYGGCSELGMYCLRPQVIRQALQPVPTARQCDCTNHPTCSF